jgi:malate synthase
MRGTGCVPLFNLMEDAATAEISRAQLWQWSHQQAQLKDGRKIDVALCDGIIDEELAKAKRSGDATRLAAYEKSAELMRELIRAPRFVEFLTVPAYQRILREGN